jgi:hypothetical protein
MNVEVHMGDTWTCHVCGRTRADADIKVRKFVFMGKGRAGVDPTVIVNVRYCADTQSCFDGTPDVPFMKAALKAFA